MIKFTFPPKIWEGRGANLEKCWKNVKIIGFLIFFGTFKIKGRVIWIKNVQKGGFYPSRAKLEQLSLISLEK